MISHYDIDDHAEQQDLLLYRARALAFIAGAGALNVVILLLATSYGSRSEAMVVTLVLLVAATILGVSRRPGLALCLYCVAVSLSTLVQVSSTLALPSTLCYVLLPAVLGCVVTRTSHLLAPVLIGAGVGGYVVYRISDMGGSQVEVYVDMIKLMGIFIMLIILSLSIMKRQDYMRQRLHRVRCALHKASEQAQVEEQIATLALANARIANQEKSDFLARMSHELRTPLNAIMGYAALLHEEISEQELTAGYELCQDAAQIRAASDLLLGLIQDVFDLSEIESGTLSMRATPFDVLRLCEEVCATLELSAQRRGNALRLSHDQSEEVMLVHTDATWVRQILLNLLSNAIKFTQDGEVCLQVSVHEGELLMEVRDTGIGMTQGQLQSVSEEFVQASASTLEEYGGTGLGLTLCDRLAGAMGGRLDLTSRPGEGTRVMLSLPAHYGGGR